QWGEATLSCTCSVGVALYPQDGLSPEALLTNSDRAPYLAKKLGKNRYAFASHEEVQ
ncbi:MAG: diguanylate cyclase domain-containing protein, partial [Sulfuricaulis sp.]